MKLTLGRGWGGGRSRWMLPRAQTLSPHLLRSVVIVPAFCKHQDGLMTIFYFSDMLSLFLFVIFFFLYFCGWLSPKYICLPHFPLPPFISSLVGAPILFYIPKFIQVLCYLVLHKATLWHASTVGAHGGGCFMTSLWGRQDRWCPCCIDEKPEFSKVTYLVNG